MRITNRELTDDPVLRRTLELLKEKGKTEKDMVEYLGIGNGAFTHWKYDNQKSFHQHIRQMSEYLGVTPNYLLFGKDEEVNTDTLSANEIHLVKLYRQMQFADGKMVRQCTGSRKKYIKIDFRRRDREIS